MKNISADVILLLSYFPIKFNLSYLQQFNVNDCKQFRKTLSTINILSERHDTFEGEAHKFIHAACTQCKNTFRLTYFSSANNKNCLMPS
jgi:hypothetical protein